MAFLGRSELNKLLAPASTVIKPFDEERLKEAAYELCLGNEVYLTDSATKTKEILDDKKSQVVIKPGQFALLLTQETINMPSDKIAFISIKFSQKIKGLINVSGFHVDPGFKGKIIFSVFNAGPANIALDKGAPYFMIWFSDLKGVSQDYDGKHQHQNSISAELTGALQGDLASPSVLLDKIKVNESSLTNIKWAAGIVIGIAITISVKVMSDYSKFNDGYELGLKEKTIKEEIHKALNESNIDSITVNKVDSILSIKHKENATR